jgi:hypothetical protein
LKIAQNNNHLSDLKSMYSVQRPTLGPEKRGRYAEGYMKKISGFRLVVMASDWPLLTGGRYSEVVVRTGLTVCS